MPPRACTGSTRIAPIHSRRKRWRIWNSTVARSAVLRRKLDEVDELAELRQERVAEKIAVRGVERAVAKPVIRAVEGDDAMPAGGEKSRS